MRDAADIVKHAFDSVLEKIGTSAGQVRGWKTKKGELPPVAETPGGSPKKKKDMPEAPKQPKKGEDEPPKKRSEIEMPPEMAAEPMVSEETPGGKKLTQEGMAAVAQGAKATETAARAAKLDGPEAKRKATEAKRLAESAKQRAGKGKTEDAQALSDRAKKVAAEAVAAAKESQRKKTEGGAKAPAPPADPPSGPEDPNEARREQAAAQGEEAIATPSAEPTMSAEDAAQEVSVAQERMSRAKTELADVLSPGFQGGHPQAAESADLARAQVQAGEIMADEAAKAAQAGDHDQAARLSSRARDAFLDAADAAGEARSPFGDDSPQAQKSAYTSIQNMTGIASGSQRKMGDDPSLYLQHLNQKMSNEMAVAGGLYKQGKYLEATEAAGRAQRTSRDIERHVAFGHTVGGEEKGYLYQPAIHDAHEGISSLRGQAAQSSPEHVADLAGQTLAHGKTLDEQVQAAVSDGTLPGKDAELWRGEFAKARSMAEAAKSEAAKGNAGGAAYMLDRAHTRYTAAASEVEGALILGFVRGVEGSADQLRPERVEEFTNLSRKLIGAMESGEKISAGLRQELLNTSKTLVADIPGGGKAGARASAMVKDIDARVKDVQTAKKNAAKAAKDAAKGGKVTDDNKAALRDSQRRFETSMRQVSSMWSDFLDKIERMEEQAVAGKSLTEGGMTDRERANDIVEKAMAKGGTAEGASRGWETRRGRSAAGDESQPSSAAPAVPPTDEGGEPPAQPPAESAGAGGEWTDDNAGQSVSSMTSALDNAQWMWQEGAPDPSGVVQDERWKRRERGNLIQDVGNDTKRLAGQLPEGHMGREILAQAGSLATSPQAVDSVEGYTQATRTLDQARRVLTGYASDEEITQLKQDLGAKVRERAQTTGEAIPDWANEGGAGGGASSSGQIQIADALQNAIGGEGGEEPMPPNPAEKAQAIVAGAFAKAGSSEGASRGWETRRGRSAAEETPSEGRDAALEEQETEVSVEPETEVLPEEAIEPEPETEVLPEEAVAPELGPETEVMPGEAPEELPTEHRPEHDEMETPVAVGPEPETEELPLTPEAPPEAPMEAPTDDSMLSAPQDPMGPPVEPPVEPPTDEGLETPGTPWEGIEPEEIESFDELGALVSEIDSGSWNETGWEQHAEKIMGALEPARESVRGLVADGTISPEWGEAIDDAISEMDGYHGEDDMKAAFTEVYDLVGGALHADKGSGEMATPERFKKYSGAMKAGAQNQAWDSTGGGGSLVNRAQQRADAFRSDGNPKTAESAARDMGNGIYRLSRMLPNMARAGLVDESETQAIQDQIKSFGTHGDKLQAFQSAARSGSGENVASALDQYMSEGQQLIDSVRGRIPENPSAGLAGQWREEDGMPDHEKSKKSNPLGLGLGRFTQFADTRDGRIEKAKAELLEKAASHQKGGLFDALLPRNLRPGSRVAAPNPETHRKL